MKLLLIILFFTVACSGKAKKEHILLPVSAVKQNIVFTITEGIAHPESAVYSSEYKAIFVSNVASGNPVETKRVGNIGKYSSEGKLIVSPWIKNLKAPKGMVVIGKHLYVSDVDEVVKIDIEKERVVKTIPVKGAKFLNDLDADKSGNVYISDMMTDTIHILSNDKIKVWVKNSLLRSPIGLLVDENENLLMVSWGNPIDPKDFTTKNSGALSYLPLADKVVERSEKSYIRGNLDGITKDAAGNLWVSDWMNGDVYRIQKDGATEKMYNFSQGCADISFSKDLNLLLVPQMNESKVLAVKID